MSKTFLIGFILFFVPATLIVTTLNIMQSFKRKKLKKKIDNLEYEKNVIDSAPITPELAKIESFLKNDKIEAISIKDMVLDCIMRFASSIFLR